MSERCPFPWICARAHTSRFKIAAVASRWQRVGNVIGSEFEPHTSVPEANALLASLLAVSLGKALNGIASKPLSG